MYMVISSFLFNNLYAKCFSNTKVYGFEPIRDIACENFLSVFHTGYIVELKTIDRVITFV